MAERAAASSTERKRVRELSKYYCAVDTISTTLENTQDNDASDSRQITTADQSPVPPPQNDEQPGPARLSTDITLNALAQLGVYRFGCNRSFVSLIDSTNQHIIAEATKSISLRDRDKYLPDDGIYLGPTTLDLVWGVCPHTIKSFTSQDDSYIIDSPNITANKTRYIIRDFTEDDCFRTRPYVVGWPHMRFYAEVPLFSPAGYVLGSYCIVDDQPRTSFSDEDVATLQEIADAIAHHLENTRIVYYHRRGERLVNGLTTFVKGDLATEDPVTVNRKGGTTIEGLGDFASELNREDRPVSSTRPVHGTETVSAETISFGNTSHSPAITDTGPTSPLDSRPKYSENADVTSTVSINRETSVGAQRSEFRLPDWEEANTTGSGLSASDIVDFGSKPMVMVSESTAISQQVKLLFSRASQLLRDSMDLEGVVFLDALGVSRNKLRSLSMSTENSWGPLSDMTVAGRRDRSPQTYNDSDLSDKLCEELGFSLRQTAPLDPESQSWLMLSETLLQRMIACYPRGHAFNLDDVVEPSDGRETPLSSTQSDEREIAMKLADYFPAAKSVLFCPLWDWNKSRWLAGTLAWTGAGERTLQAEELHYFRAFGATIMSEIAQVDWVASEKLKSDFISSISHELRSPLHGILASIELLNTAGLQPVHYDIVKMVETCGLTLLDTVNHMLDFAKINNLTMHNKEKGAQGMNRSNLITGFDLGAMVEKTTEALYAGRSPPDDVLHGIDDNIQKLAQSQSSPDQPSQKEISSNDLSVIVDIEKPETWVIRSDVSAWRRIITNLLGNALKYTQSGFIKLSLSWVSKSLSPDHPDSTFAHFSITDTGCGISADFLKYKLFTPFSQENSFSTGVGLGLSIVQQIVTSLDGHIHVKSERGIGTEVDVFIPINDSNTLSRERPTDKSLDAISIHHDNLKSFLDSTVHIVGFNDYPDLGETPTGILSPQTTRKHLTQDFLNGIFSTWLGCTVLFPSSLNGASAGIAVMEEGSLKQLLVNGPPLHNLLEAASLKGIILLSLEAPRAFVDELANDRLVRVTQPYGPRKILQALETLRKQHDSKDPVHIPDVHAAATRTHHESLDSLHSPKASVTSRVSVLPPKSTYNGSAHIATPLAVPTPEHQVDLRVLVVDDNEINLKILATFMRKIGCKYETATNGLIAFEKYKSSTNGFDFVFMDISMPVMDGFTATNKIREYESIHSLRPAVIMAVTGLASAESRREAVSCGINDYLVKPISLSNIKRVMKL